MNDDAPASMFTCAPAGGGGAAASAARRAVRRGARRLVVDIHCHIETPAADALVKESFAVEKEPFIHFASAETREVNRRQMEERRPQLQTVPARLAAMDRMGVDVQAVSTAPGQFYYWAEPGVGREVARTINDNIAAVVAQHPDRFVGLATVPLQSPELAAAELERAVRKLGMRGVEIGTNVAGGELADPALDRFWAKAQELGVLVFMHPNGFTEGRRLSRHYFNNLIGNPLDTTVALGHLVFGGVLDRHPRLKVCLAHGGGYAGSYPHRWDHGHGARSDCRLAIRKKPSAYLKRLYYDTMVFDPAAVEYLVRLWGADRVLLGTDFPYDMGEDDPVGLVDRTRLKRAEKDMIAGLNAAKLLKLGARARRA